MGGRWHHRPRNVRHMPLLPRRLQRSMAAAIYTLRALHQTALLDAVVCASALVCDEVGDLPDLHATIQYGRDPEMACVAAFGATRLYRPGRPLPHRLPIQVNACAVGWPPGESVPPSHHRLPCRRVPIHGAPIGSRGAALPKLPADARALPEMQAPGARQQVGGARQGQWTQGCSEEYVNSSLKSMIASSNFVPNTVRSMKI